jgi:hypothetical protein
MAISGATRPDGLDPADDPLIRETLRLWSYIGRPFVKDFGLGLFAMEMAGGMRGTREELVAMWELLCYLYEHLLREEERQVTMNAPGR